MIKITRKKHLAKLKFIFALLLLTTLLLATKNNLTLISGKGEFESIKDSDWFWTDTEVLSDVSDQDSDNPELITDSIGNLHVVWQDQSNYMSSGTDRDIFYKRWESDTKIWTNTEVVSESTDEALTPAIAIDSQDNLHVAWEEFTIGIMYKKWTASTLSWSSITNIATESTGISNNPSIGIDNSDNIHVVWSDNTDLSSGGEFDVFYKIWNETKQAWSTTQVVSTESTTDSFYPKVAVDTIGNVHVVWDDATDYLSSGVDRDIFYKYLDASTKIWQPAEIISNESTVFSLHPDIAIDSSDNLHVVWDDDQAFDGAAGDTDIFYRVYNKDLAIWEIPEVISDTGTCTSAIPSIDIDLDDNIHVAWEDYAAFDREDTYADIFYRFFSSNINTWSTIEIISTDSTTPSRFSSIAVGKYGSVNIAWIDYTNLSYYGLDIDIHFKRFIGPPTEPTLAAIVPVQIGIDTLDLTWNDAEGVRQYYVYRDTSYIFSVDHLDPIFTISANTIMDTLPTTGVYYYVVVVDNVFFNSSVSNCVFVEYSLAHVREFVISFSILTIVATIVITLGIRRKRNQV